MIESKELSAFLGAGRTLDENNISYDDICTQSIRGQQDRWLDILQELAPNRKILVQMHLKPSEGDSAWLERDQVAENGPYVTRGILLNEVVLDFDHPDPSIRDGELANLRNYVDSLHWPYYVCETGGKGVHVHFFLDPETVDYPSELGDRIDILREKGRKVDVMQRVRTYVGDRICKEAGLIVKQDGKNWIDRMKYTFDSFTKGSLIRIVGCIRDNGHTKRLLNHDDVPQDIPSEAPRLVDLTPWADDIVDCIESKVRYLETYEPQPLDVKSIEGMDCISKLIEENNGVPETMRNNIAFSLSTLLRLANVPQAEAEQMVDAYSRHCKKVDSENEQGNRNTLRSVYRKSYSKEELENDARKSCGKIHKELEQGYCDCSKCPLSQSDAESAESGHEFDKVVEVELEDMETVSGHYCPEIAKKYDIIDRKTEKVSDFKAAQYIMDHMDLMTLEDTRELLAYKNGIFVPGGNVAIDKACQELLEEHLSLNNLREIKGHIERSTFVSRYDLNEQDGLVCLANGVFDLKTKELKPHDSKYKFTVQYPVKYDPEAKCPKFEEFLEWAFTPEDTDLSDEDARSFARKNIDSIWELFGYLLMNGQPYQKAFLFYGPGENGKDVVIDIMTALVGQENTSSVRLEEIDGDKFAIADLYGKLLNRSTEVSDRMLKGTSNFKTLTSDGLVTGQFKRQPRFTFRNKAKLVFACNQLSATPDTSRGFYRRWIIFEMLNVVSKDQKDPELARKLIGSEISGILNKAIEGYDRLNAQGRFTNDCDPDIIAEKYDTMANSIEAFVTAKCEIVPPENVVNDIGTVIDENKVFELTTDIWIAYEQYCKEGRIAKVPQTKFGKKLIAAYPIVVKKKRDKNHVFYNIKLLEPIEHKKTVLDF